MDQGKVFGAIFVIIGISLFVFKNAARTMIQKGFMQYYNVECSKEMGSNMVVGMGFFALGLGFYFCFIGLE